MIRINRELFGEIYEIYLDVIVVVLELKYSHYK